MKQPNNITIIVVTYVQFDSNIRVLYVFKGFFKNTAQNTQSGKGYAKNHYRAAKTVCGFFGESGDAHAATAGNAGKGVLGGAQNDLALAPWELGRLAWLLRRRTGAFSDH